MTSVAAAPGWQRERRWLGIGGLLPVLACTGVLLAVADPGWRRIAADTLSAYAAVIASFLGAVHWGAAAQGDQGLARARLRWSITPALIAWTLLALPVVPALAGFAALFAAILIVDRYLLPVLDDSYRQLRLQLSVVVIGALGVAALAVARGGA